MIGTHNYLLKHLCMIGHHYHCRVCNSVIHNYFSSITAVWTCFPSIAKKCIHMCFFVCKISQFLQKNSTFAEEEFTCVLFLSPLGTIVPLIQNFLSVHLTVVMCLYRNVSEETAVFNHKFYGMDLYTLTTICWLTFCITFPCYIKYQLWCPLPTLHQHNYHNKLSIHAGYI